MKTDAIATNSSVPYIYEYYNIFSWFQSPCSAEKSAVARILNSLTEGLNKIHRLPKYILLFPGKDILDSLRYNKNIKNNLDHLVPWLVNNVNKVIRRCHKDLKSK